jgi:hypothetical protein
MADDIIGLKNKISDPDTGRANRAPNITVAKPAHAIAAQPAVWNCLT